MEDINIQENDNDELPVQGSGSILAAERKKQNKKVEEIADALNLSVTQVRTIELDQTDGLPEPTYVRGYIRAYANLLEIDPAKVLNNYLNPHWKNTVKLDDMPRGIGSADVYGSDRGGKSGRIIVLLLVTGVVGFLWYSGLLPGLFNGDQDDSTVSSSSSSAESTDTTSVDTADNEISGLVLAPVDGLAESTAVATQELANDVAQTDSDVAELELTFSQTSWVDIRDSDDTRLAYKSYVAGDELIVSSDGPMSVFIGNAEGVTVNYNGERFDIEQYREGVYAKFSVNDD